MTYGSKLANWFGLMGLAVAVAGCPGDDSDDTGAESGPGPTTSPTTTDPGTTTDPPATTTMDPATTDSTTGDPPATCDPPCEADQECIEGTCFDLPPADSSSGEPPAECGLGVTLMFPNPACGACLEANCCEQLQVCFGDETVMMETECLQLNNCIAMNCAMAMTQMELQMCVDMNCMDFAGSINDWLAYQVCAGMSCVADCS